MPAQARAFGWIALVAAVVGGFLGPFILGVLYAVAFFLLSSLASDGEGSFERTLSATAWGFVPAIFSAIVPGALTWFALRGIPFPDDPSQLPWFVARIQHDPIVLLAGVLGVVFLLWQAFLWTFAVRYARSISLRGAAITVGVPVAVAILMRANGLV